MVAVVLEGDFSMSQQGQFLRCACGDRVCYSMLTDRSLLKRKYVSAVGALSLYASVIAEAGYSLFLVFERVSLNTHSDVSLPVT